MKFWPYAALTFAAGSLLLTGCGGNSASEPTSATSSSTTPASASAAPSSATPEPTSAPSSPSPSPSPTPETVSQWGSSAEASSEYGEQDWSASQATGAPNITACGDNADAWASGDPYGKDTLSVSFTTPVIPELVVVRSTYNPGQITSVSVIDIDGNATQIYGAKASSTSECPLDLEIEVADVTVPVDQVVIEVDQKQKLGLGWTEIDAVELVGLSAG